MQNCEKAKKKKSRFTRVLWMFQNIEMDKLTTFGHCKDRYTSTSKHALICGCLKNPIKELLHLLFLEIITQCLCHSNKRQRQDSYFEEPYNLLGGQDYELNLFSVIKTCKRK